MSFDKTETLYLDVSSITTLINKVGLRLIFKKLVDQLRTDFARWEQFDKFARVACHSELGVIELMPVADRELYGFKYVNGHPKNPDIGLTTVMAFGALSKVDTGYPLLISEMTLLTAIRTATTSVLAGTYLARSNAKSMAMIGNGAQSEFQIIAFNEILGIKEFSLYDIDPKATDKLIKNLSAEPDIVLRRASSISEAVTGSDIVTTCTADKKRATILTLDQVESGMFINAIGGDCPGKTELDKKILYNSKVFVEYAPQTRIEGEIQQVDKDFKVTELYELAQGTVKGRESDDEITIFDSVGFSLEDYSILKFIYSQAEEHGVGEKITLIPKSKRCEGFIFIIKIIKNYF